MLPTVTIQSTHHLVSTFDMGLLLASVVVIAAIAWMTLTHARHHRHR
ncbi:MAG: hypothetical protein ACRES1_05555 [Steroidobacteraceae bacterium]